MVKPNVVLHATHDEVRTLLLKEKAYLVFIHVENKRLIPNLLGLEFHIFYV